jgi:hypothetical protein
LAYNDILRWCEFRARGPAGSIFPRIWRATIIPRVTTTDSLESYTNQEPGGLPIAGATNATPIACTFGTYLGSVGSPPVTTAATVSITSTNSGTGTTFTTASTTGLVNGMWCAALSAYVASFVANTSVTLNTSVTFTAIAYTFGGAASGQTTVAVSSASGIGLISTSAATVGGQAFQAGGATYVVTSISGTTVTFSPALAANIIAGQSLVFGTTSPAGASIGATSVTVGYSGYQTSYDTYWNATNMVFVGQQFALAAPANTTASGAVAVGATSLIVASATGIATGQGFQFYGAAYTVTSVSGTTVNFSPALTAAISNGAPLTFGVYTVTGVNYATNAVSFTPALLTAISAGGYINFQSQITIRNGAGNTAVNGTFYPACNLPGAATFSLYSDYLYQSPVSGNGTYTASSAMLERPWTEAQRQVYNAWVRAGCPMLFTQTTPGPWVASNYTPVAPGTTGAITDTSPLHPLFGTFDAAGAVEYNSTGVLTVGASYWQTSASPFVYSIDGVHPTQACYAALSATVPVSKITAP